MKIDTGFAPEQHQEIAAHLSRLLADSYTRYLRTHNYHWNVTGPLLNTLHTMFEDQYTELAAAIDEIAERIHVLGIKAQGSYRAFAERTSIQEAAGDEPADGMIRQRVAG